MKKATIVQRMSSKKSVKLQSLSLEKIVNVTIKITEEKCKHPKKILVENRKGTVKIMKLLTHIEKLLKKVANIQKPLKKTTNMYNQVE